MSDPHPDYVVRWLLGIGTAVLVVVLAINVWILATGRITSARAIDDQISSLTQQVSYLTCLNAYPVDARDDPLTIAACQTTP